MELNGLSSLAANIADQGIGQEIGITVLKKAMQIQAASATELLSAVSSAQAPASANLPPHLGQNINTTA